MANFLTDEESGFNWGTSENVSRRRVREHLDQFDTSDEFISRVIEIVRAKIPEWDAYLWIDSSAYDNKFLRGLNPSCSLAFDLEPSHPQVKKRDWLTTSREDIPSDSRERERVVCMNPPYGRRSLLARKFVEHAVSAFAPAYMVWLVPYPAISTVTHLYEIVHEEENTTHYTVRSNGIKKKVKSWLVVLRRRLTPLPAPQASKPDCVQWATRPSKNVMERLLQSDFMVYLTGNGSAGRIVWIRGEHGFSHYRDGNLVCGNCTNWCNYAVNQSAVWCVKLHTGTTHLAEILARGITRHIPTRCHKISPAYITKNDLFEAMNACLAE